MPAVIKNPSERFVHEWRDIELAHSHRVWKNNGLTDDSPKEVAVNSVYKMYRNDSWDGSWGGISQAHLIEVPMMFSLVNTLMAKLFARHPRVDVHTENPTEKQAARRMEVTQNFLIRKRDLGMKRQLNRALLGMMLAPFGAIRHGFSPEQEVFDDDGRIISRTSVFPDTPWIQAIDAPYLRMDPMANSFHPDDGVRWCAFYTPMTMRQIERTPGLIKRRDLRPTRRTKNVLARPEDLNDKEMEAELQIVDAWTIYDGEDRTWFTVSEGSDKPIREEAPWPLAWRRLPVNVSGFNPQLDTPFFISPASIIAQLCRERNKVRTLMLELVKRMRRLALLNSTRFEDDDLNKLLSRGGPELAEFVKVTGTAADAVAEVALGGDPSSLLTIDSRIEEDARLALGQSLQDRGQRINVESATESANVQEGADLQSGRMAGPFDDFMSDVFATHGQALQTAGILEDVSVPILGEIASDELFSDLGQEERGFLRITRDEGLQGTFIHEVRPGSAAPRNPEEEAARALRNLEVASSFPDQVNKTEALSDYFVAVDKDPARMVQEAPPATQAGDALANAPGQNGAGQSAGLAPALQSLSVGTPQ